MNENTQPIDDLVYLPYIDVQLDLSSFGTRLRQLIRGRWFKPKKWLRVPALLRTAYTLSHVIVFIEASSRKFD